MSWFVLFFAGLLEVAWAVGLKVGNGKPLSIIAISLCLIGSVLLLAIAIEKIPLGTAYAVWTGIGIIGTFVVGCVWLNEPVNGARIAWAAVIAIGVIGMELSH
ncbi:multidrug efflux SMR transporter [Candidatus Obscuribacterales bacterium]|nr:multidrug efflux SMR transporter [Candidatus Obscuribacterales bacterium]MBX3138034.1 multidrug efflux SMR transporter [Candidatus Obscuribacterales bacterium]MBX3153083.1 multidrug efflux SMR transporter [Candidatus Obscuribacterales bacterium]